MGQNVLKYVKNFLNIPKKFLESRAEGEALKVS